jgi:putative ABC transport system substrate-binding protein
MRRRRFLGLGFVVVSATAGIAGAQAKGKRMGVMRAVANTEFEDWLGRGLREYGWIEGRNLTVERRLVEGTDDSFERAAADLAALRLDLILARGTAAARAARKATTTTPIIFGVQIDPVETGLVASLPHPGGNATGFYRDGLVVEIKQLTILRELAPSIERVGVVIDPRTLAIARTRATRERLYGSINMQPLYVEVSDPSEIEPAIAAANRQGVQVLITQADPFWAIHRAALLEAARKRALPVVAADSVLVADGALFSLNSEDTEAGAVVLAYIDKVLRGAKPADLPVQQPTRFEFVINVAAARELGIAVPQSMLLRADRVIR